MCIRDRDETALGVDITGDGDLLDTNNIFAHRIGDAGFSPLCKRIEVAVPTHTQSIDSSKDDSMADLNDSAQLFAPEPVPGTVLAVQTLPGFRNCPQQAPEE